MPLGSREYVGGGSVDMMVVGKQEDLAQRERQLEDGHDALRTQQMGSAGARSDEAQSIDD